jgi:hypothetical protein
MQALYKRYQSLFLLRSEVKLFNLWVMRESGNPDWEVNDTACESGIGYQGSEVPWWILYERLLKL